LLRRIGELGARVVGIEESLSAAGPDCDLEGRLDLRLAKPPWVVDLKWSGATRRKSELEKGGALQLACYAKLAAEAGGGGYPDVAYFLVEPGRFLSTAELEGTSRVDGPPIEEVWAAAERGLRAGRAAVEQRRVACATESQDPKNQSRLEGEELVLLPRCEYCHHDVLCGREGR
jgi:hypothetical protein